MKAFPIFLALTFSAIAGLPPSVAAQTLVLEPIKDTYICDCKPDANSPGSSSPAKIYIGQYGACYARTLLAWDLQSIPSNATLTQAILRLKSGKISGTASGRMTFFRIDADWVDTTVTFKTAPRYNTEDTIFAEWPESGKWLAVDITPYVRFWRLHRDENFGVLGHCANTTGVCAFGFDSRETKSAKNKPQLVITYEISKQEKASGTK